MTIVPDDETDPEFNQSMHEALKEAFRSACHILQLEQILVDGEYAADYLASLFACGEGRGELLKLARIFNPAASIVTCGRIVARTEATR